MIKIPSQVRIYSLPVSSLVVVVEMPSTHPRTAAGRIAHHSQTLKFPVLTASSARTDGRAALSTSAVTSRL